MADINPSAKAIVNKFLDQLGLGPLGDWAWQRYVDVGGGDAAIAQINLELPDQTAFKARFPAYQTLRTQGQAMSPAEMLAYEEQARNLFHQAGLPSGFYDSPDDFAKFMVADVSVVELQQRVQVAQRAAYDFNPESKQALKDFYGLNEGDLTAMALDPNVAQPLIEQRYVAAETAGIGRAAGVDISRGAAEELAQAGVTSDAARQGFGQLAQQQGLYVATAGEDENVGADEQAGAVFGTRPEAARRVGRRRQSRTAQFEGRSGYGAGQGGVSGIGAPG